MKKFLKISFIVALCLALVVPTTASAISTQFAPYEGYEYNEYSESVAAPIGYLPSKIVKGTDFKFDVKISEYTDICQDTHNPEHITMTVLDGKAGIIYRTDNSLNVVSVYKNFIDKNGKKVSIKGATKIANNFNNSYFYVAKGNKIYVIDRLCKVVKVLSVGTVSALCSIATPKGEKSFTSYIAFVTKNQPGTVKVYSEKGKIISSQKIAGNISDVIFNLESATVYALDNASDKVVQIPIYTDVDDKDNEIFSSLDTDMKTTVKLGFDIGTNVSFASNSVEDKLYIATGNKIAVFDIFGESVSFIKSNSYPHGSEFSDTKYKNVCVSFDDDSIYAVAKTSSPRVDVFNSSLGYSYSIYDLKLTLSDPSDMLYKDGKFIYLLDSGNSRILKVNKELNKVLEIYADFHDKKKGYLTFTGAQGFTVGDNGLLYIADTESYRVIISDKKGNVQNIIERPDEQLQDTDAPFRATKVLLDRKEQIYILCDTINLGAFVYYKNGEFKNYFGSNTVIATAEVLLDFVRKQFMTNEQLKALRKITPISITNFDIDNKGFIYTVTLTDTLKRNTKFTEMVRKLNFQGKNIYTLSGNALGFGDYEWDRQPTIKNTSFCDVDVDDEGYINLIDKGRGKVFQYTEQGDLVTVFGGYSNQKGTFKDPTAIESVGNDIYVLDKTANTITIFKMTEYAKILRHAYSLLDSSDADATLSAWSDVLKYNTNSQYPYYGMGRAYEVKGDYENAMKYFKLANSKQGYSKAYEEYRKDYVGKNIWWIGLIIIAAIVIIVFASKLIKKTMIAKHGEAYSMLETKWGMPIYVLMHPVDGFEQFRTRNMQSVPIAIGLVIAWFLVDVLEFFTTGFAFNKNRPIDYDAVATLLSTVGLYILFIVANWAICTLLNGKGRMREIICVTAYSLTPIILTTFIKILLTNTLTLEEEAFVSIIGTLGLIWAAIILLLGLYTIHQYSFGGTIGSVLLTVLGMLIIGLLVVLFFTLLQQCFTFIGSVITEIKLR